MKPFTIIKVLIIVLFCVSVIGLGVQQLGYYLSEKANEEAQALAGLNSAPPVSETIPEPVETKPAETTESAETVPSETESAETVPPETESAETTPPETKPVETTPPETEPAETVPPETESAETTPPETEPVETAPPEVDDYAAQLLNTDIASLKEKNSDVFGWIVVPGTTISYPLLQGEDNNHYLYYSWDGWWSWAGSIFMDYRSSQSMTDFHTIIYGHRMNNDSMFNGLKRYEDEEFAAENPSVYIMTEGVVRRYDVFAAYEADAEHGHSYRLGLEGAENQQKLINYARRNSVISVDREVSAEEGDRMLTLSTCTAAGTSEARWVVHFVLSYEVYAETE